MIAYLIDPAELTEREIAIPRAVDPLYTPRAVPAHRLMVDPAEPPTVSMEVNVWVLLLVWGDSAIYLWDGKR